MSNKHLCRAAFLFSGALAALPICIPLLSLLCFFSFIPLLLLLFRELIRPSLLFRPRHYYGVGLLVMVPYFMVIFHWFTYLWPLDFVAGMTPAIAAFIILLACIGLPFLQALGFAFLFYCLAWLSRTPIVRKFPLLLPFLFAALFPLFSFTQTLTWAGVPWGAQLALALYPQPFLLASASFFGSYFVTFVIAAVNACLAYAILHVVYTAKPRACRVACLAAAAVFILHTGLCTLAYLQPVTEESRMTAAVLQGNIASSEKWVETTDAIAIYGRLAEEAAAAGAELIVWPETVITTYLRNGNGAILARISAIAQKTGAIQIVGAYDAGSDAEGNFLRYNALFLVYPDGSISEHVYYKRHLVPFGEYVPMAALIRTLIPPLAQLEMMGDGNGVTPGDQPALFDEAFGCIGGLICFDSIYESLTRDSVAAGAELIALGTNDSWFFDSAAVYQHNGQAVLRAVENRRWILRAANTGISSVIDPHGNIVTSIPPLVEGQAVAEVAFVSEKTLYTCIGDVFLLLCLSCVLLPPALAAADAFRRHNRSSAIDIPDTMH